MTRMMVAFGVVGALLFSMDAQAQMMKSYKWYKYKSKKYKIQVCLNTGMKMKAGRIGRWGVLSAKQGAGLEGVKISVLAYTGRAAFKQLQVEALKISKIQNRYWTKTRPKGKYPYVNFWNGFGKNATYLAMGPNPRSPSNRIVIAFLAKHQRYVDRNYIVFIETTKHNFLKRQAIFKAWGNCLRGLYP